jgi:hypothetical protein
MNRAVEAAVFENGSDSILSEGLAYDRCQVGVITNVEAPAFRPLLRRNARTGVHRPAHAGRSGAADGCRGTQCKPADAGRDGALCDGEVIFFASTPLCRSRRTPGARQAGGIRPQRPGRTGQRRQRNGEIASLQGIPLTERRAHDYQIENVLAASGAAWALGIGPKSSVPGWRRSPSPESWTATSQRHQPASALNPKEETVHGSIAYPRSARSQSVEPAHGDRSDCLLRRRTSAASTHAGFRNPSARALSRVGHARAAGHDEAVSMAQALEFAALGLQAQAGCPVTFSRTAQTLETGIYQVVVEYSEEAVGRLAFELAQDLCRLRSKTGRSNSTRRCDRLRELDEDLRLGPAPARSSMRRWHATSPTDG